MKRAVKIEELNGKKVPGVSKEEIERLRGKVVVLNIKIDDVGEGEIAKNLEIIEKGVYGIKFR
ncbi:hypothetical protein CMI45_02000 [Candidatus Pacearchaeota archaeon]|jgi:RNA polymerase subunit RPABC4/transcription elongation factor Spt4|nr:hypothetical protein [Candidatus Pacearchaeota archaeon]|tara:strand:- start:1607 stop:1795 length:189 start_codon:yes stop_codon:yes gene_type:complete